MRARAAYIHSLGTTGILVAAALMMLTVVSTIVAFDRWPGNGASDGAQSLPLESPARASTASKAAGPPAPVRLVVHPHPVPSAPPKLSTAGLVKVVPGASAPVVSDKQPGALPGRPELPVSQSAPAPAPGAASTRPPRRTPPQPAPGPDPVSGVGGSAVSQVETLVGDALPANPISPLVQDVEQGPGAALPLNQIAGALR